MQLLEQVLETYPAREWVLIADNLSPHISRETQTALIAGPEVARRFIPQEAGWLTLLEPWWTPRRSLALKGRRCERSDAVLAAMVQATMYWNAHRYPYLWKKAA
jgi:hypothetical protein